MKYIVLLVLAISFLIMVTSVYAEALHTDILRKFFTITGLAAEVTEGTTTTIETPAEPEPAPVEETPTEEVPLVEEVPVEEEVTTGEEVIGGGYAN